MKWPRLSSTATSTVTATTSLLKLGTPSGSGCCLLLSNRDGILGPSGVVSAAFSPFCRGLATVSLPSLLGPCCAAIGTLPAARPIARPSAIPT